MKSGYGDGFWSFKVVLEWFNVSCFALECVVCCQIS